MIEIRTLSMTIPEEDANEGIRRLPPEEVPVREPRVSFTPEGVLATGKYRVMMMDVSFETLWTLNLEGGRVKATLAKLKLAGLPVSSFRSMLMRTAQAMVDQQPGITMEGEDIYVDVEQVLAHRQVPVSIRLTKLEVSDKLMSIEAG